MESKYSRMLANRGMIMSAWVSPKTALRHTLITAYGLTGNEYSGIFSNVITMDGLFL